MDSYLLSDAIPPIAPWETSLLIAFEDLVAPMREALTDAKATTARRVKTITFVFIIYGLILG